MNFKSVVKYSIRFFFLLSIVYISTIYFFDKFVYLNSEQKFELYLKLVEDRNRFYEFIPLSWITVDGLFFILIFIFLIILFTTKFYTYVNELDFVYNNKYFDEYLMLYLMWNSFLLSCLYIFRFNGLSRLNLILFTFLIPLILFLFRNSEIFSNLLGRPISKENFITFNLDELSNFKNLKILAYRKLKSALFISENELTSFVINEVDKLNKIINLNLIVIRLNNTNKLAQKLENYLINLNKKVLLISDKSISFNKNFIYRMKQVDSKFLYYFNNDIQYGSKYILKRTFDIIVSLILIVLLLPLLIVISAFITLTDGKPFLVHQNRVGLHGNQFKMFKFRTMYINSHEKRETLKNLNVKGGPLFKIENDPRLIKRLVFLRKYSLDELPQLFNVIKGEMSLVGPRPLFDEDTSKFDKSYMRRLNVLPGLTGLLQINERNTSNFELWHKYDIEYIDNWSLYLDIKILFKTLKVLRNKDIIGK